MSDSDTDSLSAPASPIREEEASLLQVSVTEEEKNKTTLDTILSTLTQLRGKMIAKKTTVKEFQANKEVKRKRSPSPNTNQTLGEKRPKMSPRLALAPLTHT